MTLTHEDHGPVLRIRRPEDLLALIPHELGRRPSDECVLAVTGGERGFLLLSMARPPAEAPPEVVGDELAGALEHLPGVSDVIVVVYREAEPECPVAELAALILQWEGILRTVDVQLLTVLLVTPQLWWDPVQPNVPRAVTLVDDSPVSALLVSRGSAMEPPAPRDDPRWQTAVERKAKELAGSWTAARSETAWSSGADPWSGGAPSSGPSALAAWERTLRCVQRRRRDWVAAVLETPAADLRTMLEGLHDEATRTCFFHMLLCGDRARAESARLALGPALARVHGAAEGPEPAGDAVEEALRCVVAVAGEWDGPPHWESVETAYRILQVLDAMIHARSEHPLSAETAATVVAALAQLEVFRGRAHTAGRLLARCGEDLTESGSGPVGAVEEVRRRLARQATPWWCTDPVTGWPGRHWWERQGTR